MSEILPGCCVRCIRTWRPTVRKSDLDFGTEGVLYLVDSVEPTKGYLVLAGLGKPGERNHFLNPDRFVKEEFEDGYQ